MSNVTIGLRRYPTIERHAMRDETTAWDCDIFFVPEALDYDLEIDYESDDWQVLALDRFGDRMIERGKKHV